MRVEFKVLDEGLREFDPIFGVHTPGSAGLDLRAMMEEGAMNLTPGAFCMVPSGLAIHIGDPDYVGLIIPRSGLGTKGLRLRNTVGVIDSDYQGPIMLGLQADQQCFDGRLVIQRGDRVAQLVIVHCTQPILQEVGAFTSTTERGTNGYGSTGRK